jgi:hypothetical protein
MKGKSAKGRRENKIGSELRDLDNRLGLYRVIVICQ